jgi:hypothetical protein
MTDEIDREKLAKRIQALLAKNTRNDKGELISGCTEEEAMSSAAKARELMDKYRFTQSDVEIEAEPVEDITLDREVRNNMAPADYCLGGIGKLCGVKIWYSTSMGKRRLRLLGLKADVEMAQYLYKMIEGTIDVVHRQWAKDNLIPGKANAQYNRRAVSAYRVGMATRIDNRLLEEARNKDAAARTGSGTALVLVKAPVIEKALAKLDLHFSRSHMSGMSARDSAAYAAGVAAGDRVNLSRPVGADPSAPRLR